MPGACGLSPLPSGTHVFSTGSDTTLRVHDIADSPAAWWRADTPDEPELPDLSVTDLHEKAVGCLAVSPTGTTFATGSDDGFVRIFSVKLPSEPGAALDAELVQACARFGGPVRSVDFSPTGAFLAAAGDEPGVLKVIMTAQPTNVSVLRPPDSGKECEAVACVAFDPNGDFVVTVGERGQAVAWDIEKCKMLCTIDLNSRSARSVAWAPGGASLVFGTDKGVVVVSRLNWQFDYLLEDAGEEDEEELYAASVRKDIISAVAWSSNGRYLIAGREDTNVSLWDVHAKKVLACWKGQEIVQRLFWHPTANAMILIDKIGQWGIVPDVVPPHMPSPHTDAPVLELPTIPEVAEKPKKKKSLQIDFGDDEEEVGTVKRSQGAKSRKLKQQERRKKSKEDKTAKKAKKSKKGESEDEEDNGLENNFTFNPSDVEADDEDELRSKRGEESEDDEDESDSDEEIPGELADLENAGFRLPAMRRGGRSRSGGGGMVRAVAVVQQPFMPTSTPLAEKATKKKHILAWNLVGAVLSFDESTHDVVEIEFADASKRTIGIKDHYGYTMGCLTETGVLLASPQKKEHGSLITFRPFSSWSNNSDWTQYLPADEDVIVIALGDCFAAVATAPNNVIRLFSLSGIQTSVFGIQGKIITAAASGERLVIVYAEHDSANLRCEMLDMSSLGEVENIRYSGTMMLCPDSKLEWVGFTNDTKELCSYDSRGWLWLMVDPKVAKRWVPMMQNAAKAGECDWFWVASTTSTNVIGAPCLSNERFPPAKPRPALRTLLLSAPVIEKVTKTGKPTVIERFLRTKLRLNRANAAKVDADEMYESDDEHVAKAEDVVARMELETDKCTLHLMEEACRNEQNMRAFDLACRLHAKISFKYAIELARHFKRSVLASRVEQIAMHKIDMMEEDERVRAGFKKKLASSPMTPGVTEELENGMVSDGDEGVEGRRTGRRIGRARGTKVTMMNFDTDEEGESATAPSTVAPAKKDEKSAVFRVGDVTDDEEEEVKRTEAKEHVKDVKENVKEVKKVVKEHVKEERDDAKRKRSTLVPESQASVKAPLAKKAKIVGKEKPKVVATVKRKFHNRFLKK